MSRKWAARMSAPLCVAGLGVAAYLTVEHFTTSTTLACPETGVINCQRVTTSPQSTVLGVPLALLGIGFFAAMLALCLPAAWKSPSPIIRRARLVLAASGVLFVLYLVYVELFVVNAICLWCTAIHVLAVALFAVIVFSFALDDQGPRNK